MTISSLSSSYLQSLLETGLSRSTSSASTSTSSLSSTSSTSDTQKLSPLADLLSTLQDLQQSDPATYKSVMAKISESLKSAADTATSQNNTTAASQLNQLATDFSKASESGDLPNIQDLAQALGGSNRVGSNNAPPPPPPSSTATSNSSSTSTTDDTSSTSTSSTSTSSLSEKLTAQILAAYKANSSQSDSQDVMSIIMNVLSDAGVTTSNNA